jgi:hypothetical protein
VIVGARMEPASFFLIVIACALLAVVGMLLVRRRAPEGGYYSDSERAAGVFGALATSFAVVLAFVIFLAFDDYDGAKSAAATEALATSEQFETAELLDARSRDRLQAELICYARSVVADEWPLMRDNRRSDRVDAWILRIDRSFDRISPRGGRQTTAFEKWIDETSEREKGRSTRLLEAAGIIPAPIWFVLLLGAALVVGYMLLFADRAERRWVQGALIGTVTAIVTASLLVVQFFDHPYRDAPGSIEPKAMSLALDGMQDEQTTRHPTAQAPCDAAGRVR